MTPYIVPQDYCDGFTIVTDFVDADSINIYFNGTFHVSCDQASIEVFADEHAMKIFVHPVDKVYFNGSTQVTYTSILNGVESAQSSPMTLQEP
jgi:hypothetical protein